jgi:hypothetical protein
MLSRVSGLLLLGGLVAGGAWAIAFGNPAGPDDARSGSWLVSAATLLIGSGAGAIAIAAARPLDARPTRVGLGLAAIGLIGVTLGQTVVVIPSGSNELQSTPWVLLVGGGFLAAVVGALVVGVTLARARDVGARLVGLALLACPLSLPLAAAISLPFHVDAGAVVLAGLGITVIGIAGVAVLALGVGRARSVA